jgi:hypothetical protein
VNEKKEELLPQQDSKLEIKERTPVIPQPLPPNSEKIERKT